MKDFIGNELNIGDEVVFMQRNYRNLLVGKIISMSNKMVNISHEKTNVCSTETRQFSSQVIKVIKEE